MPTLTAAPRSASSFGDMAQAQRMTPGASFSGGASPGLSRFASTTDLAAISEGDGGSIGLDLGGGLATVSPLYGARSSSSAVAPSVVLPSPALRAFASRTPSATAPLFSLADAPAGLPRNRSATLCVDSPRNLSVSNLAALVPVPVSSLSAAAAAAAGSGSGSGSGSSGGLSRSPSKDTLARLQAVAAALPAAHAPFSVVVVDATFAPHPAMPPPPAATSAPPPSALPVSVAPSAVQPDAAAPPATPSLPRVPSSALLRRNSDADSSAPARGAGDAPRLRERHSALAQPARAVPGVGTDSLAARLDLPVNVRRGGVDNYDRCAICMEYGQMAPVSCCGMRRHARCEKRHQAGHLDGITEREGGDGHLVLPCSICRRPWRVVPPADPFIQAILRRLDARERGETEGSEAEGGGSGGGGGSAGDDAAAAAGGMTTAPPRRAPLWRDVLRGAFGTARRGRVFAGKLAVALAVAFGVGAIAGVALGGPLAAALVAAGVGGALLLHTTAALLRVVNMRAVEDEIAAEENNVPVGAGVPAWAARLLRERARAAEAGGGARWAW
jgi:hypothetical protein